MAIDVTDRVPAWVSYAEYVGGGSDKFYEIRVDEGVNSWLLTKRYGARPDSRTNGQTRQESFPTQAAAEAEARKVFESKTNKGYDPCPWPHGAAAMPDFRSPEAVEKWLSS